MNKTHFVSLLILDILVILLAAGVIVSRSRFLRAKALLANPAPRPAAAAPAVPAAPASSDVAGEHEGSEFDVPVSTQASPRAVSFAYQHSGARQVQIVGDFNHWLPEPLRKGPGNRWHIEITLEPGEYAYNFVVDGKPVLDPGNTRICNAGRGFPNSYIQVTSLTDEQP